MRRGAPSPVRLFALCLQAALLASCGEGARHGVLVVVENGADAPWPERVQVRWTSPAGEREATLPAVASGGSPRLGSLFVEVGDRPGEPRAVEAAGWAGDRLVSSARLEALRPTPGGRTEVRLELRPIGPAPGGGRDGGLDGASADAPLTADDAAAGARTDVLPDTLSPPADAVVDAALELPPAPQPDAPVTVDARPPDAAVPPVDAAVDAAVHAPPPPPKAELVDNGGFESGLAPWLRVNGLGERVGAGATGQYSIRETSPGGWWQQDLRGYVAGGRYRFGAAVKSAGGRCEIVLQAGTRDGAILIREALTGFTTGWTARSVVVTMPAETRWVQISLANAGDTDCAFDDVTVALVR